jgi:hypothetical protein
MYVLTAYIAKLTIHNILSTLLKTSLFSLSFKHQLTAERFDALVLIDYICQDRVPDRTYRIVVASTPTVLLQLLHQLLIGEMLQHKPQAFKIALGLRILPTEQELPSSYVRKHRVTPKPPKYQGFTKNNISILR